MYPGVSQQTNGYNCRVYVSNYTFSTLEHYYTKTKTHTSPNFIITPAHITQLHIQMLEYISHYKVRQHTYPLNPPSILNKSTKKHATTKSSHQSRPICQEDHRQYNHNNKNKVAVHQVRNITKLNKT